MRLGIDIDDVLFPWFDKAHAACERAGVVAGIHANGALASRRRDAGFRMITVATDLVALRAGLAAELAAIDSDTGGDGSAVY